MAFRKIEAGLVQSSVNNFIGKKGTIFYDNDDGALRLSDGQTPGGNLLIGGQDLISPTFTYAGGLLTSIAYASGQTKTFTYTNGILTRLDYVNDGVTIRKTFNYTDGVLTSITQVTL